MIRSPDDIINQLGIARGETIAEIGSGSGHMAIALAHAVGKNGHVYAIDIKPDVLDRLESDARQAGLSHVETITGDIQIGGSIPVLDGQIDKVMLVMVLFYLQDMDSVFAEIARVLKSGGQVIAVEWEDSFGGIGPHSDHLVTIEQIKESAEKSGLIFMRDLDVGEQHFGMVFKK
ncbi:MAG: methyltransferase domain-containing protein [Candidatus Nomurabacteria bacterium]|nr:methyltransferase domain-containing protein [Candidatus Nomurabacteria bacterium]